MHLDYENARAGEGYELVIGVDEAGRGPLAGPVVAAAVAVNLSNMRPSADGLSSVSDSKKLTPDERGALYDAITEHSAVMWAEGRVGPRVIDRLNIRTATNLAMRRAVTNLAKHMNDLGGRSLIVVDGTMSIANVEAIGEQETLVHGEERVFSVAAASIIAKVRRDRYMERQAKRHPAYGFDRHKGYGTAAHRAIIRKRGVTPLHRRSFSPCAEL